MLFIYKKNAYVFQHKKNVSDKKMKFGLKKYFSIIYIILIINRIYFDYRICNKIKIDFENCYPVACKYTTSVFYIFYLFSS
jgi:hypothetical protein